MEIKSRKIAFEEFQKTRINTPFSLTIGFCGSKNWLGKVIQWFTGSWVNHAFAVIELNGKLYSVDAEPKGVFLNPFYDEYLKPELKVVYFKMPYKNKILYQSSIHSLLKTIGQEYGYLQFLGMARVSLLRKIGVNVKNWFTTNWICSEIAFVHLMENYSQDSRLYKHLSKYDKDSISPATLYNYVLQYSNSYQYEKDFNEISFKKIK